MCNCVYYYSANSSALIAEQPAQRGLPQVTQGLVQDRQESTQFKTNKQKKTNPATGKRQKEIPVATSDSARAVLVPNAPCAAACPPWLGKGRTVPLLPACCRSSPAWCGGDGDEEGDRGRACSGRSCGEGVRGEHSRTWAQREHRWPSKPVLRLHGGAAGSTFFMDAIMSPAASPGTLQHLSPFSPSSGSAAVPITCYSKRLSSGHFSINTSSLVPSASTRHRTASSPPAQLGPVPAPRDRLASTPG